MKRDEDHSYNYSNISFGSAPERTRRGEKNGTTKDGRKKDDSEKEEVEEDDWM